MKEIRLHGRGGQGAAKGSEMLTMGFVYDGKYAASFPMYGAARKGGAVTAFCRYDDIPVREKTQIYTPDCLLIFDGSLMTTLPEIFEGFKPGGTVVVNTPEEITESPHPNIGCLGYVDATRIAAEEIGFPAVNTAILAALAATTGWVSVEALKEAYGEYFSGSALEKNRKCADRAAKETKVLKFEVNR